jgi:hypothetical protein
MAQAEVNQRLQVLRHALGQGINTQNHHPVPVANQDHGRNIAKAA